MHCAPVAAKRVALCGRELQRRALEIRQQYDGAQHRHACAETVPAQHETVRRKPLERRRQRRRAMAQQACRRQQNA